MNALRTILERERGTDPMSACTVLSPARDYYRLDTPANHALAKWLAEALDSISVTGRLHLRGLHYAFVGRVTKPDGAL